MTVITFRYLFVALSILLCCSLVSAQTTRTGKPPIDSYQQLVTGFNAKLEATFGKEYSEHWSDLAITLLNSSVKQSIESDFATSALSIHWEAIDQPLSDVSELIRTGKVEQLTDTDDWPCKSSCGDQCKLIFDTENSLRSKFSDRDLADVLFDQIRTSYSITVSQVILSVGDDLKSAKLTSKVAFPPPTSVGGETTATPKPFFKNLCFPVRNHPVPRTAIAIVEPPQSEWQASISFEIVGFEVRPLLRLKDNNLHFALQAQDFFQVSYSDVNNSSLHCSLPFDPETVPTRSPRTETLPVLAEVFPPKPPQLGQLHFEPFTASRFTLLVFQHSQLFQVVASKLPD